MKRIVYHAGPDRQVLPDGLGEIARGVPAKVPGPVADALVARGDFDLATKEAKQPSAKPSAPRRRSGEEEA